MTSHRAIYNLPVGQAIARVRASAKGRRIFLHIRFNGAPVAPLDCYEQVRVDGCVRVSMNDLEDFLLATSSSSHSAEAQFLVRVVVEPGYVWVG